MAERDDLDALLAAAREARPEPSEAIMARVLADAMAHQPRPAVLPVAAQASAAAAVLPFWARLAAVFGGTGAVARMGTAAVAGLAIGLVQPAGLSRLGDAMLGAPLETVELIPDVGAFLAGE